MREGLRNESCKLRGGTSYIVTLPLLLCPPTQRIYCSSARLRARAPTPPAAWARARAPAPQLDWRELLPRIAIPCLNVVGGTSGCFPVEGCLEVGRRIPGCCSVVFTRANHWCARLRPRPHCIKRRQPRCAGPSAALAGSMPSAPPWLL
jgi:pimeloyl-ACP methyl ester carboxylesterase